MTSSLGLNYIDLLIILVIILFIAEGFRHGFWVILADFLSFLGSLLISLRFYQFASNILKSYFSLSSTISNALGFLIMAILTESVLGYIFGHAVSTIPKKYKDTKLNKYLSLIPAVGEAIVLISFILTLFLSVPVAPGIKSDVTESGIGGLLVQNTQKIESRLSDIFGGAVEDSLTYLTINPESTQRVSLQTETGELEVNEEAEKEMFDLVNRERKKVGVKELIWDSALVAVARSHSKDMWERKYFGHFSPEGKDVGDRLEANSIDYFIAGENLALAPTVETAFTGLMNSEDHRRNMLDGQFDKVGIGAIENGIYGIMFVQIFTK
jgi:uncharacterized protein YkwD